MQKCLETFRALLAKAHDWQSGWTVCAARRIAEHKLRAGVSDDEMNRLTRKLEVHRHCGDAGAQNTEIGGDIFGPIDGQDGDPVSPFKSAPRERARDSHGHRVKLRIGE